MNRRILLVPLLTVVLLLGGAGLQAVERQAPTEGGSAGRTPPSTPQAWTFQEAMQQMQLNPDDVYLQYVVLQLAHNEDKITEATGAIEAMDRQRRRGRGPERQVDLFALFTGALAVQESLQLDTMRPDTRQPAGGLDSRREVVKLSELAGPTVKSHPWGKMLAAQQVAGRKPEVSPLAMCVPADQYFILFRSLTKLLEAADVGDVWGAHLLSQAAKSAKTQGTSQRLKTQLAVQTDPLTRPFYDMVVEEVAITGSDLYFREGSDVTVLFQVKQPEVFRLRMDGFLAAAEKSRPDAVRSTGKIQGVDYVQISTADRAIHAFSAYPRPNLHVRSNSSAALERVLRAISGQQAAERLGESTELKYIRTLMVRGDQREDGFIYLSDPFIRRLVGPELKLTERRRMLCYNHLRMIGHAAMLYRTQFGKQAASLEELTASGCAPGAFGQGKFGCPCGGKYRLAADGASGACSHHGHAAELVPCVEIPLERVTEEEAQQYKQFVENYSRYWQRFFDPIAIRVQLTPQHYRAETIVLPLIDNTVYSSLAMALGGEPEPLDALPVPQRNIFTVAIKLDKERLLEQAGWQPPTPAAQGRASAEGSIRASANNLRQIAVAMHNYHDSQRRFPAVANFSQANRPLLSWRVHLLPFLGEDDLYKQFQLNEPWDSEHNKKLIERMPQVYDSPGREARKPGTTTYVVAVGGATVFTGTNKESRIADIRDGTSNTILVLDAAEKHAVTWTKPDDWKYDPASIRAAVFDRFGEAGLACFCDGSVFRLPKTLEDKSLSALFTRAGGETVAEVARLQPVPSRRRDPFGISELAGDKLDQGQLYEFVTKGVGNQVGLHVYDASPFFDFNLTGFLGEMLGQFRGGGGGFDDEILPIGFLVASLNSPVYVSIPVQDAQIVDKFLDELDTTLAALARQPRGVAWFDVDFDFYRVPLAAKDERVRCYAVQLGPVKWRLFFARIGEGLYVASKQFILDDLAAAAQQQTDGGPTAHAMVRVRPEHWKEVLPAFQLGWAESSRVACLNNLGPLSSVARAVSGEGRGKGEEGKERGEEARAPEAGVSPLTTRHSPLAEQVHHLADELHAVHFFCPDGGQYVVSADGKQVTCSVHGSASAPRQLTAPAKNSPMGRLIQDFGGLTTELTFLEDGLHAVVTIQRK